MQTQTYSRRSFDIQAVQVTLDNMVEVAEWCKGEVRNVKHEDTIQSYLKVPVHRPLNERQTKAFPGDWVLYAGKGFKVYTTKAFETCFEPKLELIIQTEPGSVDDRTFDYFQQIV